MYCIIAYNICIVRNKLTYLLTYHYERREAHCNSVWCVSVALWLSYFQLLIGGALYWSKIVLKLMTIMGELPVPSCLSVFKRSWHIIIRFWGIFPCWQNSRRNGLCPYNPHVGLYAEDTGFLAASWQKSKGLGLSQSLDLKGRKLWCHSWRVSLKRNE